MSALRKPINSLKRSCILQMSLRSLQHPNVWQWMKHKGENRLICLACRDGRVRELKHCAEHERSRKHQEAVEFYLRDLLVADDEHADARSGTSSDQNTMDNDSDRYHSEECHLDNASISPMSGLFDVTDSLVPGMDEEPGPSHFHYDIESTYEEAIIEKMYKSLSNYSTHGPTLGSNTYSDEDSGDERSEISSDDDAPNPHSNLVDTGTAWFPWSNKVECAVDILRHLPRSTLSDKQNGMISWVLKTLGVSDVPSESTMKSTMKSLQQSYGIRTAQYQGSLGHIYYLNDFLGIIAQEMSNPFVRPHLHFMPELSDNISAAYQAQKWMFELDLDLLTPMIRHAGQDFYTLEPVLLSNDVYCIPVRWFMKAGDIYAHAWQIRPIRFSQNDERLGWAVFLLERLTISKNALMVSFPYLCQSHKQRGIPDPTNLFVTVGENNHVSEWRYTDPSVGNRWRTLARGHIVLAFPIWLYCDDTSGNSSKRWNKHNSYFFTAAGLSHKYAHLEYNAHFLCTSNIADPLEMMEGIVEQLEAGQTNGIWAFDCVLNDKVLLIPSVLALLGDNPMQSEMACHIGFNGNLPCRICLVSSTEKPTIIADSEDSDEDLDNPPDQINEVTVDSANRSTASDVNYQPDTTRSLPDNGRETDFSDEGSNHSVVSIANQEGSPMGSPSPATAKQGTKGTKKKKNTMQDYVNFAQRLIVIGPLRNKELTTANLHKIFKSSVKIGGIDRAQKRRTSYGVKDTYQDHFLERINEFKKGLTGSKQAKQKEIKAFISSLPENTSNPVWRIRSLDAHSDTPVEILHVVLLGFVKYFWRDAMARISDKQKALLATRLESVNIQSLGLRLPRLAGRTLVKHAGSLVGRDFRAVVQVAPFVLYDLVPEECYKSWLALSSLIPLIWQPVINNLDIHVSKLRDRIDNLLNCVANWSPRWFNKMKFHVLLHLVDHVRRFGPPILFATETFEACNAIIRSYSIHSNRQAPSRDIGMAFANLNRLRHLLSGGKFCKNLMQDNADNTASKRYPDHGDMSSLDNLLEVGDDVKALLKYDSYVQQYFIPKYKSSATSQLVVNQKKKTMSWLETFASRTAIQGSPEVLATLSKCNFRSCKSFTLHNDDNCKLLDWVIFDNANKLEIGQVVEILQIIGSSAELECVPNFALVSIFVTGPISNVYQMPKLVELGRHALVEYKFLCCCVNVQHNCAANNCGLSKDQDLYQERIKLSTPGANISHINVKDVILNICQMRSYQLLQSFCTEPVCIDRQNAIFAGAAREIAVQRAKANGQDTGAEGPNMLQTVLNPLQSSGGGVGQPRGRKARGGRGGPGRGGRRGGRGNAPPARGST